jgi:hypothetical protein
MSARKHQKLWAFQNTHRDFAFQFAFMSGFPTRPSPLLVCEQVNHYKSRFGGHGEPVGLAGGYDAVPSAKGGPISSASALNFTRNLAVFRYALST